MPIVDSLLITINSIPLVTAIVVVIDCLTFVMFRLNESFVELTFIGC